MTDTTHTPDFTDFSDSQMLSLLAPRRLDHDRIVLSDSSIARMAVKESLSNAEFMYLYNSPLTRRRFDLIKNELAALAASTSSISSASTNTVGADNVVHVDFNQSRKPLFESVAILRAAADDAAIDYFETDDGRWALRFLESAERTTAVLQLLHTDSELLAQIFAADRLELWSADGMVLMTEFDRKPNQLILDDELTLEFVWSHGDPSALLKKAGGYIVRIF